MSAPIIARTLTVAVANRMWSHYDRKELARLWAGRDGLTPGEVAALDIPANHREWFLLRWPGLTDADRQRLATDFAGHVVAPTWPAPLDAMTADAVAVIAWSARVDLVIRACVGARDAYAVARASHAAASPEAEWQVAHVASYITARAAA